MKLDNKIFCLLSCLTATLLISVSSIAQYPSWLKNDSLQYHIKYSSFEILGPGEIRPATYTIGLGIGREQTTYFKQITYQGWMTMLKDTSINISTNLVLYSITNKSAFLLAYNNKRDWFNVVGKKDLVYWKRYLKTNMFKLQQKVDSMSIVPRY